MYASRSQQLCRVLFRPNSLAFLLHACLAVLSTWPLAKSFFTRLPIGTEPCRTVPMFNLWTLEWNVRCAENYTFYWSQDYWDAPIFFPAKDSLAMSEAQPILVLLAPVVWLTGSTIAAYNTYIILSLLLNGWFARRLLKNQDFSDWIATLGGAGMLLLPVVHWQLGVAQLVPIWGIIWGWDIILRWAKSSGNSQRLEDSAPPKQSTTRETLLTGFELGLAWICTFAMSVHHGLFACVMYAVALAALLLLKLKDVETIKTVVISHVISAVLVGIAIGPMLWRHHTVSKENGFEREASLVEQLSVWPSQYLTTYGHSISNWLIGRGWETQTGWSIGAGLLISMVAIMGLIVGLIHCDYRRITLVITAMSIVAFTFSMGNHFAIGEWSAWEWLVRYVPGFSQVRSAYRFIYFLQIAIVVLAFIAVRWIADGKPKWRRGAAAGLAILCTIDPWPCFVKLGSAPSNSDPQPVWIDELRNAPKGGVVILPLLDGGTVFDYEVVAEWMLVAMDSGKPIVNGYSGFFPKAQLELGRRIIQSGLDRSMIAELKQLGVRYIVVSPFYKAAVDLEKTGLERMGSRHESWDLLRIP